MSYLFSSKVGRRGRKVINHPVRVNDMNFSDDFAEMYDQISRNWREKKDALMKRRQAALKYL